MAIFIDHLEPAVNAHMPLDDALLASIAISLKRIADALEQPKIEIRQQESDLAGSVDRILSGMRGRQS